jgi:hypothetical protein
LADFKTGASAQEAEAGSSVASGEILRGVVSDPPNEADEDNNGKDLKEYAP